MLLHFRTGSSVHAGCPRPHHIPLASRAAHLLARTVSIWCRLRNRARIHLAKKRWRTTPRKRCLRNFHISRQSCCLSRTSESIHRQYVRHRCRRASNILRRPDSQRRFTRRGKLRWLLSCMEFTFPNRSQLDNVRRPSAHGADDNFLPSQLRAAN